MAHVDPGERDHVGLVQHGGKFGGTSRVSQKIPRARDTFSKFGTEVTILIVAGARCRTGPWSVRDILCRDDNLMM